MRTFVHLAQFASAIAMAVGAFGPLVGAVEGRNIAFEDLRDGFPAVQTLEQVDEQSGSFATSLTLVLLIVAAVVLLAALFGSRALGWLAVLAGVVVLGVLAWRLDESFGLFDNYRDVLGDPWGLYAFGGELIVALLALLIPRERTAARTPLPART
ncbi:hypothetical protein [Nocardia crassostreae]|uniref:hypothetical protein n=1 Tax=Nocardia crassostreae TaxID=53428 RepID=UPI00083309E9|nr:hypothetical protein [Nocardia crassostreae]